jgi:hypothetical protein
MFLDKLGTVGVALVRRVDFLHTPEVTTLNVGY